MSDFQIVTKSLRARLFSTVVTVISVAVAVALMLNLLSMRDASRRAFQRGTGNMEMVIAAGGQSPLACVLDAVYYARAPQKYIPWVRFKALADPRDRRIEFALPVQQGDNYRGYPTMAVNPDFFVKFNPVLQQPFATTEGALPRDTYDVTMGAIVARAVGAKVGDKVVITHGTDKSGHAHEEHPYKVTGILAPTGTAHDRAVFITLDSTWIIHADEAREQAAHTAGKHEHQEPEPGNLTDDEKRITGVYLRTKDPRVMGQVYAELRADPELTVAIINTEINNLWNIVGGIDRIVVAIAAAVLVSSGIGILLALYNSMEQRRRQIAVLRVLGASRGRVFSLVLSESAVIGLLGAVGGIVLGYAAIHIVSAVLLSSYNLVIAPDLDAYLMYSLVVLAATVILACLAGLIPALTAYNTPVARSLRPLA